MKKATLVAAEGTRRSTSRGPRYTVHHTSQTDLAARHSAPDISWWQMVIPGGIMTIMYFCIMLFPTAWCAELGMGDFGPRMLLKLVIGILSSAVFYAGIRWGIPGLYAQIHKAAKEDDDAMMAHLRSWVCMDCGSSTQE